MTELDLSLEVLLLATDRRILQRKKQQLLSFIKQKKDYQHKYAQWTSKREKSIARFNSRHAIHKAQTERLQYPAELPLTQKKDELLSLISKHQVVIVAGETGSGKTTQLPKLCLELGRGLHGLIGHTQPRRLAARTVAERIAEECKSSLGVEVGFQVRFKDTSSANTLIKLMTDGILLNEIHLDRQLNKYDTLIIDEAHERSLNIDFILGYLKQLLPKRPDLKVIITSATIDLERFSTHFSGAPIIEVSGRTFPVDTLYMPPEELNPDNSNDLVSAIVQAMLEIERVEHAGGGYHLGDVLVFLPGEREIRDAKEALDEANLAHCQTLPLYARLSNAEQRRVFTLSAKVGRRIILATNVAETSLTVLGIRYVIDSGLARISRYSYRSKVQRLPIEAISQASANQRRGRCGRIGPGIAIRLYCEEDFESRPAFTEPEILRTQMSAVILQSIHLGLGDIANFPFIEPPDSRFIKDGYKNLEELGAIDASRNLTDIGRTLNQLPLDPNLGRMIIAAAQLGCLNEVLIITSGLSIQDPRERPADKRQKSDEQHARFNDKQSDFQSLLNLWDYFEKISHELSQNLCRKRCRKEFLSIMRLREWRDIYHQLCQAVKSIGFKLNQTPAASEPIHRALLAGLLSKIGRREEKREYLGARNRYFYLFPGSALHAKPPQWIMASELVETTKLYARVCASIEPEWALDYAKHLLKYDYTEPHWSTKHGKVMAWQSISLYGLTLVERSQIPYETIDAALSHELFIRDALVNGAYGLANKQTPKFWQHNQNELKTIEALEAKARTSGYLLDEQAHVEFYKARIPESVANINSFESYRLMRENTEPRFLFLSQAMLQRSGTSAVCGSQFPDTLLLNGQTLPVHYHFEPGSDSDGVNVTIPQALLTLFSDAPFEWLVPGILEEKCIELFKCLPKVLRKQLVPLPDTVKQLMPTLTPYEQPLLEQLCQRLFSLKGIEITPLQFDVAKLHPYYKMRFIVTDSKGKTLATGRELNALKSQFEQTLKENLKAAQAQTKQQPHFTEWAFDSLEKETSNEHAGLTIKGYPAIVDKKDSVSIEWVESESKAQALSKAGLNRLIRLKLSKEVNYLKKSLFKSNTANLAISSLFDRADFINCVIDAVIEMTFLSGPMPKDKASFEQVVEEKKSALTATTCDYERIILQGLTARVEVLAKLKGLKNLSFLAASNDIQSQLTRLYHPRFAHTPLSQLKHYPRYMKALLVRVEKIKTNPEKDRAAMLEINALEDKLYQRLNNDILELERLSQFTAYRWLLEEFRVSLFAQNLKTASPVSAKRLNTAWKAALAL